MSHADTVLLAVLADRIGLTALLSEATDGLRERRAGHDPGRVLVDAAVAIADGAVAITDIQAMADHEDLHGPAGTVASTPTIWRVLAAIGSDEKAGSGMLTRIRLARAEARDRAWAARGELTGSELPGSRAAGKTISEVVIDLDATLVTAHSEKDDAKGNFKRGFGHHPLGAWLDNSNEALAMLLRPGNAGSNTGETAENVTNDRTAAPSVGACRRPHQGRSPHRCRPGRIRRSSRHAFWSAAAAPADTRTTDPHRAGPVQEGNEMTPPESLEQTDNRTRVEDGPDADDVSQDPDVRYEWVSAR